MHPILAIVGRPNVGKSRLFNRIIGRGKAIVADTPGVTRDRHLAAADWRGREFIAVDTGGLDLDPDADLEKKITKQSVRAIEDADVVVCVFDGQLEPTAADKEIVKWLRRVKKPVIYAINKIDESVHEDRVPSFHEFGLEPVIAVSAEHGRGVDDLLDEALKQFPAREAAGEPSSRGFIIAVVGRPNVGKSTLINRLAGEERVIVHETPGTTRDAIDVEIDFDGKKFVFIDTAGVKRGFGVADRLEKFTAMKSLKTIVRSQIVLQLIDGHEGLTKQDLNLAGFISEEGKGQILIVNKLDIIGMDWGEYEKRLEKGLGELRDIPVLAISAATGQNCLKIFDKIEKVGRALGRKIPTSALNECVERALQEHHMPVHRGRQVRINYATQVATHPPTFALFSNLPSAVPYSYRRYIIRRIKEAFGLEEIPVRVVCRKK